jgi:hypothetical protein
MTDQLVFTPHAAWDSGWCELAVALGPADDSRLEQALLSLWAHTHLEGCDLDRTREPTEQPRVAPGRQAGLERRLFGVATLGELQPIACSSVVVREDSGSAWLYFGLPMGSLGRILPVGAFPIDDGRDLSWRAFVDDWGKTE